MKTTLLKTAVLTFFILALGSFGGYTPDAYAGNPCNPCGGRANACNPCGGKKMSNPCGGRANACNPCNPCASRPVVPLRSSHQPCVKSLSKQGKKSWNNEKLGTSGFSCMTCHDDHELLTNKPWPHYINMAKDVMTLDQMINFCMLNPMEGKKIDPYSLQMTSMGAFYNNYMKTWKPTVPKKGGNPCNPCGGRMMNPCGGGMMNPCGGGMMNPCGGKMKNPCNPCGR